MLHRGGQPRAADDEEHDLLCLGQLGEPPQQLADAARAEMDYVEAFAAIGEAALLSASSSTGLGRLPYMQRVPQGTHVSIVL